MRIGYAIDLHGTAAGVAEVAWPRLREQALVAEQIGIDLVVVPDHLRYAAGGDGDYAREDVAVGAWESFTIATALAVATTTIGIGHSMLNMPYRAPALVAHAAMSLDAVSGGRYSLGVGSGNSFDYDALGVDATNRAHRFAEALPVITGLLRGEHLTQHGRHITVEDAEVVLRGPRSQGPPVVVAAGGPRAMRLAATHGDAWNGWVATDPDHAALRDLLAELQIACQEVGRDPTTLGRTVDLGIDPLDLEGGADRSRAALLALADLGIDEVRCYPSHDGTHASRVRALQAMAPLVAEVHAAEPA